MAQKSMPDWEEKKDKTFEHCLVFKIKLSGGHNPNDEQIRRGNFGRKNPPSPTNLFVLRVIWNYVPMKKVHPNFRCRVTQMHICFFVLKIRTPNLDWIYFTMLSFMPQNISAIWPTNQPICRNFCQNQVFRKTGGSLWPKFCFFRKTCY